MTSSINVASFDNIGEESKSGYDGYNSSRGSSSAADEMSSQYVEQADDFDQGLSAVGSLTSLLAASEESEEEHESGLHSPIDVS